MVVPTEAVSEEGTSRHYPLENQGPASTAALNTLIEGSLGKGGLPYRIGSVWTTDAPYRETPSKISAYGQMGVLAVEMEMAALMTVALFRGVSLGGLLVVSDELFDLKWRAGFSSEPLKRASALAVETLLDAVKAYGNKAMAQGPLRP
jgi:uridine phosphorylase